MYKFSLRGAVSKCNGLCTPAWKNGEVVSNPIGPTQISYLYVYKFVYIFNSKLLGEQFFFAKVFYCRQYCSIC